MINPNKLELSERLKCVMGMVTPGLSVADIGCDHGYLSIYLIKNNIAKSVIACDVNAGPLEACKKNAFIYEVYDKIDYRISDGLDAINPGEVESVVMAGMGGRLMSRILEDAMDKLDSVKELVLQPQSEISMLRKFVMDNGFMIISESMVCEEDKYYPVFKAVKGRNIWEEELYLRYGKILLREENPVLHQFLFKERDYLKNLYAELIAFGVSDGIKERLEEVKEHISINKTALDMVERPGLFEKERVLN